MSPSSVKKRRRGNDQEISPPPLRRKLGECGPESRPKEPTKSNQLRIFSWNVNGVSPFLQKSITSFFSQQTSDSTAPPTSSPLRDFLRRHAWPEILCLQEVKINPRDEATKRALEKAANGDKANDDGPKYSIHFCLPRDKYNAKGFGGKVYGVATLISDNILSQVDEVREVEWDLEGRVLITVLRNNLVIINGYWVNGTENPYRDPSTGQVSGTRHHRKRAFHQLMLEESLKYEKQGYHAILAGDMNIARTPLDGYPGIRLGQEHVRNRYDFNERFFDGEMGMRAVDTFRHIHGDERKYSYHPRGIEWGSSCDRVDLIMVSRALCDLPGALVDADILDNPKDRGHSDHVPLFASFDTGVLN